MNVAILVAPTWEQKHRWLLRRVLHHHPNKTWDIALANDHERWFAATAELVDAQVRPARNLVDMDLVVVVDQWLWWGWPDVANSRERRAFERVLRKGREGVIVEIWSVVREAPRVVMCCRHRPNPERDGGNSALVALYETEAKG